MRDGEGGWTSQVQVDNEMACLLTENYLTRPSLQRGHHTYLMNWANSTGCMLCQGLQSLFTQQLYSANMEIGSGGTLFLTNSLHKALPPPESEP